VTLHALRLAVRGAQCESGPVVIEAGAFPARCEVAVRTVLRGSSRAAELAAMFVFFAMATRTLSWSPGKARGVCCTVYACDSGCLPLWFVTLDARDRLTAFLIQVGPIELKPCAGMVERAQILPLFRNVAGLAGQVSLLINLMWIRMTCVAVVGRKVILAAGIRLNAISGRGGNGRQRGDARDLHYLFGTCRRERLVAVDTCDLNMLSGQGKLRLRVAFN